MKKKFRAFEQAIEFTHSLKLTKRDEWKAYTKSGKKPTDIPNYPPDVYKNKGWRGWQDWLGYERKSIWRPFQEAKDFIQSLQLKGYSEWEKYCKSEKKPDDIPTHPHDVYKSEWKGYRNWLGTEYLPFTKAREFARSLDLKSYTEWIPYYKSDKKPANVPANPPLVYKHEWKGWGDWLGTGNIAPSDRKFKSFTQARKYARSLKLKNGLEWRALCKTGKTPKDIPKDPQKSFKKQGWKGWGDWLGTFTLSPSDRKKQFRTFSAARKFVQTLGLRSKDEWLEYVKSKEFPKDLPAEPRTSYKKEWKGWGYWLGTGTVANFNKVFLSIEEARDFVHTLQLKGKNDWDAYCDSGKKPDDIPRNPSSTYKNKGWTSWGDWFGTGRIASSVMAQNWQDFKEARNFIRSLGIKNRQEWNDYCKSNKKPADIPAHPWFVYAKERVLKKK